MRARRLGRPRSDGQRRHCQNLPARESHGPDPAPCSAALTGRCSGGAVPLAERSLGRRPCPAERPSERRFRCQAAADHSCDPRHPRPKNGVQPCPSRPFQQTAPTVLRDHASGKSLAKAPRRSSRPPRSIVTRRPSPSC